MAATLRVSREASFGFELRAGTFDISLDGATVRSITWGETVELSVEPGPHTLQIRKRRYSSLKRSFEARDGETIGFRCHGAMLWPRWVSSFAVPSLGISLKRG